MLRCQSKNIGREMKESEEFHSLMETKCGNRKVIDIFSF